MRTAIDSPFGQLFLEVSDYGLRFLGFRAPNLEFQRNSATTDAAAANLESSICALTRYFEGEATALDSIPVDLHGTEFQKAVWMAARTIPFGNTISYGALARLIGRPQSSRAVGAALGANPVCIVIPCHRVISSVGKLHGFSGGLDKKQRLLLHEHAVFSDETNSGAFHCSAS